jgi:hypothetical protein
MGINRMVSKPLVVAVIILFLGVGIQPVRCHPGVKNQLISVNEENEKINVNQNPGYPDSLKRKVYLDCQVDVSPDDGKCGVALLLPGVLKTLFQSDKVFVVMNSGIVINGGYGTLYLNSDIYKNFEFLTIVGFTGYMSHSSDIVLRLPKFYLNGTALYVAIYFN